MGLEEAVMSAHPGEKVDACLGNRNLGEPVNRFAIGDLGFQTHCLSRVRRESHARFYGGRELATASGYPPSYVTTCLDAFGLFALRIFECGRSAGYESDS
jgi:hypothetical protein